ncbi:biotin synthase BioB [Planctomycetota bacterium]
MKNVLFTDDLLALVEMPLADVVTRADRLRREHVGEHLELCGITNAKSGLCGEDCKFCAQSRHHAANVASHALLSQRQLVQAGVEAKAMGAARFGIVTSGNRLTDQEVDTIATAVTQLVHEVDLRVCGSLGALDGRQLAMLRSAGMSRYHHNIETSRRYYREIVSTHDFEQRVDTIQAARAAGLEVCSGGIIGMGETWQDRLDMAVTLRELEVDSVPINILSPIPGTPFEHLERITAEDVVRTLAIFRIVLPDKTIKMAAGREATLGEGQIEGFKAGANGMIIGGYLTIKGAALAADKALVEEVRRVWKQSAPS